MSRRRGPQEPELEALERQAQQLAHIIGSNVAKSVGFTLLLYQFGEGGWLTYVSNAQRADMIRAIVELLERQGAEEELAIKKAFDAGWHTRQWADDDDDREAAWLAYRDELELEGPS